MSKKIFIFYATAGIGHKKAALAIKEAFDREGRDALLYDALDYSTDFFKMMYLQVYLFLVRHVPTLWGFFYYILDNPLVFAVANPIRRLTNHLNSFRLVRFLLDEKPDVIIVTHFFALDVVAALKRKHLLHSKLICVMTDYQSHTFWLTKYADLYVAGSDYTRDDLVKRGIPAEKIYPFGIPCSSRFSEKKDVTALKAKLGLDAGKKTIFVLAGGFGIGPVEEIASCLDRAGLDFQVIVVCGYNKRLEDRMDAFARGAKHVFKIFGFVDNVDELMAVSDVLVSKTGGISTAESLAAELPMMVIRPIPGQEMRNFKFLLKNGAAVRLSHPGRVGGLLNGLFAGGGLAKLKENVERVEKKDSGKRVMELALS